MPAEPTDDGLGPVLAHARGAIEHRLEQTGGGVDGITARAVRPHLLRPDAASVRRRPGRHTQVIRQQGARRFDGGDSARQG
jgi:hypothetical protein